jgi:DNA adenine methylase
MNLKKDRDLEPLLKWPGGKEQELPIILKYSPKNINRYFEPFIGGGALYFNINAQQYYINDKSIELINLYNQIKDENPNFYFVFNEFMEAWRALNEFTINNFDLFKNIYGKYHNKIISKVQLLEDLLKAFDINNQLLEKLNILKIDTDKSVIQQELLDGIYDKMIRMSSIESKIGNLNEKDLFDNIETGIKGGYYMYMRLRYNNNQLECHYRSFLFLFIRNYTYSGMFRYNKKNEFNVPYGGIGYNSKNLQKKYNYYKSIKLKNHLQKTTINNDDFEEFLLKNKPQKNDFIFLDPPYDTEFSTYALNSFEKNDQVRLSNYLIKKCKSNWMLVIKKTDFILSLYDNQGLFIHTFDKKYMVSFMNRNDKDVEHLMITNYSINE